MYEILGTIPHGPIALEEGMTSPTLTSETGGWTIAANDGYGPSAFMLALEVPEPSSLALFGIGALACARRRRK